MSTPKRPPVRVVNIDGNFKYDLERERLAAVGAELAVHTVKGEEETIRACAGADIVLIENADQPFNARIISTLDRCRAIVRYGVGVNNIDVDAATAAGIVVGNAADFCTEEVSDHTIALILACARRIVTMDRTLRAGGWEKFPRAAGDIRRVSNLTLGLIGLGRIGRMVVRKMSGFQMRILASDPYLKPEQAGPGLELVSMERVAAESDLISVHAPLGPGTRGLVGEKLLRQMKPTAFLINTSRGPVIDEAALTRAIEEKWIAGAALDVMVEEPLAVESPLRRFDHVILTPHYAAYSQDAMDHLHRTVTDAVVALASGHLPAFVFNPQVRPRFSFRPRPA